MTEALEATRPQTRKRWYQHMTLSLSAFIMSLTMTAISAFYALRGSEVDVQPPSSVLLYRDGEGANAVLSFAVRLPMINGAADYGDLLLGAELEPRGGEARLKYQALAEPVFTKGAKEAAEKCALGVRCLPYDGLLVMENSDQILDVPAGSAKSPYLTFTAAEWACAGDRCKDYATFDQAVARIASAPLDMVIRLSFNEDGDRRIICRGTPIQADYLRKVGWLNVACVNAEVKGGDVL